MWPSSERRCQVLSPSPPLGRAAPRSALPSLSPCPVHRPSPARPPLARRRPLNLIRRLDALTNSITRRCDRQSAPIEARRRRLVAQSAAQWPDKHLQNGRHSGEMCRAGSRADDDDTPAAVRLAKTGVARGSGRVIPGGEVGDGAARAAIECSSEANVSYISDVMCKVKGADELQ